MKQFKQYDQYVKETYEGTPTACEGIDPIIFLTIGMAGEAGEVANDIKKLMREDMNLSNELTEKIKHELGDVLWYLTALAHECNISLTEIVEGNVIKINERYSINPAVNKYSECGTRLCIWCEQHLALERQDKISCSKECLHKHQGRFKGIGYSSEYNI